MGNRIVYEAVDINTLDDVRFKELTGLYQQIIPGVVNMQDTRENMTKSMHGDYMNAKWVLATKNNSIVGMVTYADVSDTKCYMFNLNVKKEFRRQGIGKKLFKNVLFHNKKKVTLSVAVERPELVKMYQKWGCHVSFTGYQYVHMEAND